MSGTLAFLLDIFSDGSDNVLCPTAISRAVPHNYFFQERSIIKQPIFNKLDKLNDMKTKY